MLPSPRLLPLAITLQVTLVACAPAPDSPRPSPLSITEILGGGDGGSFARALAPRELRFPDDHGPHPDFRTEWWYFTGSLSTEGSAAIPLGYQLTFFRNALASESDWRRRSSWAASQAYMAHFALSRGGAERQFLSFERFARGAAGLAGAAAEPFHVWLEDWSARGGHGIPPIRLRAGAQGAAIDLTLATGKPPVLQGDRGLSRKGREPGNASHYYSLTRLPTSGRVTLDGESLPVTGISWMDREWSTSSLDPDVVGWDWFALQLDDGFDLMVYQLRRRDGSADPLSAGALVDVEGGASHLTAGDYRIEPLDWWTSPRSARRYPARWRLVVPDHRLDLEIAPLLADQELSHSFIYWEGAVLVSGSVAGQPLGGRGYVELTGY